MPVANGSGSLVSPLEPFFFDNPKPARCRSPVFNGFSIVGLLSSVIFYSAVYFFLIISVPNPRKFFYNQKHGWNY